ncbi:MAG: hypothetical protein PHX79_07925 [Sphaerochaetaceae bacterium]|nr:hypothetical protein [Sphaerochaetaceae bacterium]
MKKIGVALLLVLFIIFAFSCQSVSLVEKSRTISVQGTGRVSVSPDVASFSITVSELGETTREAHDMGGSLIPCLYNIPVPIIVFFY